MDNFDKVMEIAEEMDTDSLLDVIQKAMEYMTDKDLKRFLRYVREASDC